MGSRAGELMVLLPTCPCNNRLICSHRTCHQGHGVVWWTPHACLSQGRESLVMQGRDKRQVVGILCAMYDLLIADSSTPRQLAQQLQTV